MMNMVVEKLPELAQAFASQLSSIDKINIIDMGGSGSNNGGGGVNKMMSTVGGGMTAMFAMLKDQFGIDVPALLPSAAAAAKEEKAPTEPAAPPPPTNGAMNGAVTSS